ncbi:MAG: hypothetical protein OES32_05665 [Acidobacteriota bacterium]|nr:hypothetical protein [Acidobacteriota bacterium]
MDLVDIHSHVLPGADDGAATFAEAVEMLAIARAAATAEIVATPHMFAAGLGSDDAAAVRALFDRFVERLQQLDEAAGAAADRPRLHLGAENYVSAELLEAMAAGRVQTLGPSRSLLVELWPLTTASAARHAVDRIQAAGYVPVVAHVERYRFLHERPALLEELVGAGWVAQVNGAAVLGQDGLKTAQLADRWLRRGLVSVIASDGHGARVRSPALDEVRIHVESRYGATTARLCLRDNPLALLADRPVVLPPEVPRFRWPGRRDRV